MSLSDQSVDFSDEHDSRIYNLFYLGKRQSVDERFLVEPVFPFLGCAFPDQNATCGWYVNPPDDPANFLIKCSE
jgi:hypothetical protein